MANWDIIIGIGTSMLATFLLDVVAVKLYNYATGGDRDIFWRARTKLLTDLDPKKGLNELKTKLKILVIDDEDIFPLPFFKDNGYIIDRWEIVKDYLKIENGEFDIIVLDIKGVALHISEEDGMGVLESIKRTNPTQVIVANSMHSYDLSKQKFFKLADDTIFKPASATSIKEKIDNLIITKFSVKYPLDELRRLLIQGNYEPKQIQNLENKLARFHQLGTTPNWGEMLKFIGDPLLRTQINNISNRLFKNLKM